MSDNVFNKAERLVRTALGLLERDTVLARLVWRDAGGDFAGAKGDVINVRLPAYAKAKKRALRSGDSREKSALKERLVTVSLDNDIYLSVPVTDEELSLDVESFAAQVLAPMIGAEVRGVEDEILAEVEGAEYPEARIVTIDPDNPLPGITRARRLLNDARVPFSDRSLVLGSGLEEVLINKLTPADESGSTGALREASLGGRLRGFNPFAVPGLDPEAGYAFHRSAYVLSSRAPAVPRGAPYGATGVFEGFAVRIVQAIDPDEVVDNVHTDVWTGTNHVTDVGEIDDNGFFEPAEDPEASGVEAVFVRAVKLELGS